MQHTLIAVFDNRPDAQNAMSELLGAGFDQSSVRLNDDSANQSSFTDTAAASGGTSDEGVGASIKHFFSNLFGDDDDTTHTQKYSNAIAQGHHTLVVTTNDEAQVERAADIVERFGPVDIDEKSAQWSGTPTAPMGTGQSAQGLQAGASMQSQAPLTGGNLAQGAGNVQGGSMAGSQQRDMSDTSGSAGGAAIPVVEEQLKVGKREVQRGGVRVYSRIVETPVQENVSLREEHVNIERRPVDQPITADAAAAFKEQTIELRETGEEVVVQKTARVVEEVVVGKAVTERQESINDTVRHTEVEVEQLGTPATADDTGYRSHWSANYGSSGQSYDDYAPAYSYGGEMANQYRGRQWNDVESDLRTNWESRNGSGDASTWEKFKGAVRHGWDGITK